MKAKDEMKPVEIFSGSPWEATLVKSILENEQIEAFLKDEIMGTLTPWHSSPGAANSVKVLVSSLDLDKAIQIVKAYEKKAKEEK